MQMNLNVGEREIYILSLKGRPGQVVKYIGSNHWKVRYLDGNATRMYSFTSKQLDFNGNNVEELKKRYQ